MVPPFLFTPSLTVCSSCVWTSWTRRRLISFFISKRLLFHGCVYLHALALPASADLQPLTSGGAEAEPHNQDLIPYYQTYLLCGHFQPAVWKLVFLSGYIIYNQWGQTWIILGFHASTAVLMGLLPPGSFSLLSCLHFILFCFYRGEYKSQTLLITFKGTAAI